MPGTVSIGGDYHPVEVDLWGKQFVTVPATRSVSEKAEPLIDKLNEATDLEDIVKGIGALLDIKLNPVEGAKKASTLVREKWKADEVTIDQLNKLLDDIREADRPT